jgi:elongation factor P
MNANSLRVGNVILHKNGMYRVLKLIHTKPGKGGAFMQTELKEIKTGQKLNERFRSEEKIERVSMMEKEVQFLYRDGDNLEIVDLETFDQMSISIDNVNPEHLPFMRESDEIIAEYADDQIIGLRPQIRCEATIIDTDPYLKGQTVTSSFKQAKLDNGVTISVPPFLINGQKIIVNTETMEYMEKV